MEEEQLFITGMVLLFDFSGYTVNHFLAFPLADIKKSKLCWEVIKTLINSSSSSSSSSSPTSFQTEILRDSPYANAMSARPMLINPLDKRQGEKKATDSIQYVNSVMLIDILTGNASAFPLPVNRRISIEFLSNFYPISIEFQSNFYPISIEFQSIRQSNDQCRCIQSNTT